MQTLKTPCASLGALFAAVVADDNVLERIREDQPNFFVELQSALIGDGAMLEGEEIDDLQELDFSNLAFSFAKLSQVATAYSGVIDDILMSRTWATDQTDGELVASVYAMLANENIDRPALDSRFSAFASVDASDITEIAALVKNDRGTAVEALSSFRTGDLFANENRRRA